MKRSMLQTYVSNAAEAIALYQRAFDATLLDIFHTPEGKVFHSELDLYGQMLSVADEAGERVTGNTMQFCLHMGEGQEDKVMKAYEALKEGAQILQPLGPCMYSSLMTDLIDAYGVRWCIFV